MSEMGFYLLPTGKLHKKTKKSRLKNIPASYVGSFYWNLADNVDNFLGSDFYGKSASNANIPPHQTMFKNASLLLQILPKACRHTLTIM